MIELDYTYDKERCKDKLYDYFGDILNSVSRLDVFIRIERFEYSTCKL